MTNARILTAMIAMEKASHRSRIMMMRITMTRLTATNAVMRPTQTAPRTA